MTVRRYGVEAEIFDGMGHGLMLERDWSGWPPASSPGWKPCRESTTICFQFNRGPALAFP